MTGKEILSKNNNNKHLIIILQSHEEKLSSGIYQAKFLNDPTHFGLDQALQELVEEVELGTPLQRDGETDLGQRLDCKAVDSEMPLEMQKYI